MFRFKSESPVENDGAGVLPLVLEWALLVDVGEAGTDELLALLAALPRLLPPLTKFVCLSGVTTIGNSSTVGVIGGLLGWGLGLMLMLTSSSSIWTAA